MAQHNVNCVVSALINQLTIIQLMAMMTVDHNKFVD